MRYFVIGDDGQKYGPADVPTLKQWITDGRLLATTIVENEATGERMSAQAVPGLNFPIAAPPQSSGPVGNYGAPAPMGSPAPTGYVPPASAYPRPSSSDNGAKDLQQAWIFCVLGLLCCPIIFNTMGFLAAKRAEEKGNPGGATAKIANIIAALISIISGVIFSRLGAGR